MVFNKTKTLISILLMLNLYPVKLEFLMDFDFFLTQIYNIKNLPLGGFHSQFKMAPDLRKNYTIEHIEQRNPKESAVLALFYPDIHNNTNFLLTLRARYQGVHSSQISFPGGKKDGSDKDLKQTALRETEEEMGIKKNTVTILREMTKTYIPPSNFWVTPFVGMLNNKPVININNEVEKILEISVKDLLNDKSVIFKNMSTSYMKSIDVPCYNLNDNVVWGATAMMLSEIKDMLNSL
jgi:8-oxo-dGTP pyrophosphatase MutT (NUDIX family)